MRNTTSTPTKMESKNTQTPSSILLRILNERRDGSPSADVVDGDGAGDLVADEDFGDADAVCKLAYDLFREFWKALADIWHVPMIH